MGRILKKLNILLDKTQKRTMGWLLVLMVISAGLQTLGVGMIMPVVQIVMDSEAIAKPGMLHNAYLLLGGGSEMRFTVLVMLALVLAYVLKNVFLFFQQRATLAFAYSNQFRTSERMMRNYLRRSYEFYLNADTAVIQRNITANVNNMYALILALLQLISDIIVFIFLVVFLLIQDAAMTILIAAVMILLLAGSKCVLKPVLQKVASQHQDCYSGLLKWISQTVQGVKEIKIACKEQYFVEEYQKYGNGYVSAARKNDLYSQTPKLIIETMCVACMIGYILYMIASGQNNADMMATLTAFAAAAVALLPCVNRINNQLNKIDFCEPFLMAVSDDLQEEISNDRVDMSYATDTDEKLPVREKIELKDIVYAYPGTEKKIFDHADLTIPVGKSVGIVGTSGAGKSTVVDILLGLLQAQQGEITADGVNVMAHYRPWLKNIGYIPQMIFMLDDTIRKNVCFGVPEDKIDEDRLWEALREAQLDTFIRTLPEGLDTSIGERGIRLSGGQRQRIGIARALYHDPEVLILDEATSALDNDTEAAIMESINRLQGRKTLIIIAHRLQTIEKCDLVYRVQDGRAVLERGSLDAANSNTQ
ncbi:MAG: ABC transporter ATP-binding protein [Lachnospiraceae bacterium]|nr:ABC transporter ATP-binding protein [Lachnospiraceae bacterium]